MTGQIDLNSLSKDELLELRKNIDTAFSTLEKRRKDDFLNEVQALAETHGFSMTDLREFLSGSSKKQVGIAKYRNPENLEQTWTGRGRKPNWVVEGLEAGKSLEDFAIDSGTTSDEPSPKKGDKKAA